MEVLGTGGAEEGLPPLGIWEFTSVFDHHDNGDLMDGAKDILPCTGHRRQASLPDMHGFSPIY